MMVVLSFCIGAPALAQQPGSSLAAELESLKQKYRQVLLTLKEKAAKAGDTVTANEIDRQIQAVSAPSSSAAKPLVSPSASAEPVALRSYHIQAVGKVFISTPMTEDEAEAYAQKNGLELFHPSTAREVKEIADFAKFNGFEIPPDKGGYRHVALKLATDGTRWLGKDGAKLSGASNDIRDLINHVPNGMPGSAHTGVSIQVVPTLGDYFLMPGWGGSLPRLFVRSAAK